MSNSKPSIAEVLYSNRKMVMALLGIPVLGMLIAVVLLIYKSPDNLIVILGVILFVGVQYILMMFFFMKKIENLAKKEKEEQTERKAVPPEIMNDESPLLAPEEKRIFPLDDEEANP